MISKRHDMTTSGLFRGELWIGVVGAWMLLGCPATEPPGEDGGCRKDTDC